MYVTAEAKISNYEKYSDALLLLTLLYLCDTHFNLFESYLNALAV